jgi:peptidoglycan/LPS O-acetylase OafA/YrhL
MSDLHVGQRAAAPTTSQQSDRRTDRATATPRGAFRSEIQGLRAIAVGLVVLFHLWPLRVAGGYVGVDVFFVISGYLITSHLMREVDQSGTVKVARFWARRIRRLLPASLLVLALSAIAVVVWIPSTLWSASARQIAASGLYIQNWALAFDAVDYMALDNVPTVAQHYWSLSVEEQFYLVWPLLVIGLLALHRVARRRAGAMEMPGQTSASVAPGASGTSATGRRRVVLSGLSVLTVASLVWSGIATAQDQPFAYMSTFTRAWEFGAGALTAFITVTLRSEARAVLGWLGLVAVLSAGWAFTERSPFPGWIALLPVVGTVALIVAGRGGVGTVGWWLSRRPATFLGDISYSIYLVHWPLIVLAPYVTGHALTWPEKLVIVFVTVVLAWLSKTLVEDTLRVRPLLAAKPWRAFAFAASGMVVLLAANLAITHELDRRETVAAEALALQLAKGDVCIGPGALDPANGCPSVAGLGPPVAPPDVVTAESKLDLFRLCQQGLGEADLVDCSVGETTSPTRTVALLGDSHAGSLIPLMDTLGKKLKWRVIVHTKGSCPATDARRVLSVETSPDRANSCAAYNKEVDRAILADPSIEDVFVATFSSAYQWDSWAGEHLANPGVDGFTRAWSRWAKAGKHIYVIRDVPRMTGAGIPTCLAIHPDDPPACGTPRAAALPADVAMTAARSMPSTAVTTIDLTPAFCDDTLCHAQVGSVIVYRDVSHLSVEYARLLAPLVEAVVTGRN